MKTKTRSILALRPLLLAGAALLLLAAAPGRAHAQANLTFSGGLGTPLRLTLNAPVTYAVTTAGAASNAPFFVFQGVGNVFGGTPSVSGTVTFSINGGAAQTFNILGSGGSGNSLAATDAFLYGSLPGLAVGNVVVLTAGTLTTSSNFVSAPPAGGSFPTFIIDGSGNKLDAVNGVAGPVPEPSTWALLGVGTGLLGVTLHRRARLA
jgi:hypothetical protein